jgi:hypothetical protein
MPDDVQALLSPLPRIEELPTARRNGLDRDAVQDAFRTFERLIGSLRGQLRELQEAPAPAAAEPQTARGEGLELIQAAAAFAETLERDARQTAGARLAAADADIRERSERLAARETEIASLGRELDERHRAAVDEARRAAEAEASRILDEARAEAADRASQSRAETERRLEWARAQSDAILRRARNEAAELRPLATAS